MIQLIYNISLIKIIEATPFFINLGYKVDLLWGPSIKVSSAKAKVNKLCIFYNKF